MKQAVNGGVVWSIVVAPAVFLVSCGGSSGGSSSAVAALTLPDRIEISQVDDDSQSGALHARSTIVDLYSDAGTDYTTAEKETWADDTDTLDMVNQVLGAVQDTGYQNFVNQGSYKALIRAVGESSASQSGTATTSAVTENLQEMYVNVSRASSTAPMIVRIWLEEDDGPGGNSMLVRGYFEVSQGVSDDYPYGVLEAHFKGTVLNEDGTEGADLFTMAMSVSADDAGNVEVEFVENGEEGSYRWNRSARVIADADMTSGTAYAYDHTDDGFGPPSTATVYFAFNGDYFKVKQDGTTTTLDKNDFFYKVYRYKIFEQDSGDLVTMSSGFPLQLADGGNGYIGYYGLWVPKGVELEDGDTVTRVDTGEAYTLVKVGGKLTKHTRTSIPLGELTGVEMNKYECGGSCVDYVITWDGSNFRRIGYRTSGGAIEYYSDPGDQTTVTFNQWEGAWCESLRAYLRLGSIASPSDSSVVYYHAEETVDPAAVSTMTLYYWGYALDAPITQGVIDSADESSYWASPSEKVYTFDASTLLLEDEDGDPVLIGSDLDLSGTNYTYGYCMGPLTTTQFDGSTWWQANEEETYYTWQTGSNDWNQFATLVDGDGGYVVFSAPMRFTYTHSTANDLNDESTYDGKKFSLEYDGFELRVPWEYDETAGEWQPLLNLKDGTVITDGTDTYIVKGTAEGLLMQEAADPSLADDLVIDETIPAPTLTYDATKTALVGAVPTGTVLTVIKGEVLD